MAHALVRAALIIAAVALGGCMAGSSPDPGAVAGVTGTASGTQGCASDVATHTIVVQDAGGHVHRLVHCPGRGWKHLADRRFGVEAPNLSFPHLQLSPVISAHALSEVALENDAASADPLAVFIDGPTGYTFAWTGEDGWRFVGRISEEHL